MAWTAGGGGGRLDTPRISWRPSRGDGDEYRATHQERQRPRRRAGILLTYEPISCSRSLQRVQELHAPESVPKFRPLRRGYDRIRRHRNQHKMLRKGSDVSLQGAVMGRKSFQVLWTVRGEGRLGHRCRVKACKPLSQ
jgi:hypothetical protein